MSTAYLLPLRLFLRAVKWWLQSCFLSTGRCSKKSRWQPQSCNPSHGCGHLMTFLNPTPNRHPCSSLSKDPVAGGHQPSLYSGACLPATQVLFLLSSTMEDSESASLCGWKTVMQGQEMKICPCTYMGIQTHVTSSESTTKVALKSKSF